MFRFRPSMSTDALRVVARITALVNQDETNVGAQLDGLLDFMDAMATGETAELIATLGREGIMQIGDLVDLQQSIVQAVAARPTTRSSSSASGSTTSGASSTEHSPSEESTPQLSPPIAS